MKLTLIMLTLSTWMVEEESKTRPAPFTEADAQSADQDDELEWVD